MKFSIRNHQEAVSINETFWNGAFTYASKELNIEHHHAEVVCFFFPMSTERKVKFKLFSLGATGLTDLGAMFYVLSGGPAGRMIKTFFHEMTHVKQLLMGELVEKPRHRLWKGGQFDKKEYADAPWEKEANAFSDKAYEQFLRREVTRVMADESVHAYHPAILQLRCMFVQDDVFRLTQEVHREREKHALASSPRD
jgi:hypothetical protein